MQSVFALVGLTSSQGLALLVCVAVFATVMSVALPMLSGNELKSRMKAVALEREEVRAELRERLALHVRLVPVNVVVLREPLRDRGVALLVRDERGEDLSQRRIHGLLALRFEQCAGEPLDAGHVEERLDHGFLFLARQVRRRQ